MPTVINWDQVENELVDHVKATMQEYERLRTPPRSSTPSARATSSSRPATPLSSPFKVENTIRALLISDFC